MSLWFVLGEEEEKRKEDGKGEYERKRRRKRQNNQHLLRQLDIETPQEDSRDSKYEEIHHNH